MDHTIRPYDRDRDLDAVTRIWLEIGWLDDEDKKSALGTVLDAANTEVADVDGEAECMVQWAPGSMMYQQTPLPMCVIAAVTTSHIGRRRGFASAMTTRALQQGVDAGCAVAALGMFEQGFYDRLGFGTGAYEHKVTFDPASLLVDHVPFEPPVRLSADDFADMHSAMIQRLQTHGNVCLDPPDLVHGDLQFAEKPFALGYRDASGKLTHFVAGEMKSHHGPWYIRYIAYQNREQLLQLFRLLKELGDQLRSVTMIEPAHIQLQALLKEPVRERDRSISSKHESGNRAAAWTQLRILDMAACVEARRWPGPPLRFNLTLADPVAARPAGGWNGIGGDYTISIGDPSSVADGHTEGLPTIEAGVGAFTRLWFGVRPATTLATTDDLHASAELLASLDVALALPRPLLGWEL